MGGKAAAIVLALLAGLAAQDPKSRLDVVRLPRADAGGTARFDPDLVERNYRKAAAELRRALARVERQAVIRWDEGSFDSAAAGGLAQDKYDSGLPDPVRTVRRTWRPASPLPPRLRSATIYVVTVDRNGQAQGLPEGRLGRSDGVLVSRAARLKDCAALGTFTLLTREVAERLGIQRSRARCVVSADGTEIDITEGDRP